MPQNPSDEVPGFVDDMKAMERTAWYVAMTAGQWRAGAHTDYDCLTLLFQREGQDGLQVCPARMRRAGDGPASCRTKTESPATSATCSCAGATIS